MKTLLKKTVPFLLTLTLINSHLMSVKNNNKKRQRPVTINTSEPTHNKSRKLDPSITKKFITIVDDDQQIQYSVNISPQAAEYSLYLKTLLNTKTEEGASKTIYINRFQLNKNNIYFKKYDVKFFFNLLEKWAFRQSMTNNASNHPADHNVFKYLDNTDIVSIITLTSHFIVTDWFPLLAKKLIDLATLDEIKDLLQKIQLDRVFLIEILKKLFTTYNETAIGNITEFTDESFSLTEIDEIKPLNSRVGVFGQHSLELNPTTLHCSLCSIKYLREILENNNINIKTITSIDLSNNCIKEIDALKPFTNLSFLNLNNNKITNIEPLQSLENLECLYLRGNKLSSISSLKDHKNLTELNISGPKNKIKDPEIIKTLQLNALWF